MIRYLLFAFALLIFLCIAALLIVSLIVFLVLACVIGVPLWLVSRRWMQRHGMTAPRLHPIERLQNLYAEGKIDLFEFERRVARLVAIEQ